ncbi:Interferon-related developmental regulator 1 [Camellia lanceoleosa]|uniref:Interferon-related developmental regulator 1 n=1 Tax=Camellia lanceoleosa TaxID=1840588 RepID=A0ACC0GXK5_9ERIC|nr:Interferon-related developmental regulator 1 [Camellia lanceoleosa]
MVLGFNSISLPSFNSISLLRSLLLQIFSPSDSYSSTYFHLIYATSPMGKRSSRRKNAAMLDTEDSDGVSSWSSGQSNNMEMFGTEEVQLVKESLLDQCLDALYEKRGSTREKALVAIIEAFNSNLQHEFVEKKFVTLLHQCLNSIKRGSVNEISLASRVIGLLALTTGPGDKAQEILEDSVPPISQALKSGSVASKTSSLLECLAIVTFVGGTEPEETEKAMQIMWQVVHPKQGSNVVATKPSSSVIMTMVSAWSFLLTTMDGWTLDPKNWQESISYFSTLLEKDDRSIRITAGEALALIFEIGDLEKLSGEAKAFSDSSIHERNVSRMFANIQGLRGKILNQVRNLSMEAGGKGSNKKDLNSQRNLFRDILHFLESGYPPETSMKIGGVPLKTTLWSQLIQLNFLKRLIGGGFIKHMQENEFLYNLFGFTPQRTQLLGNEHHMSSFDKRFYKSPNSVVNKARTQIRNKQRILSQGRNTGHYTVGLVEELVF